MKKISHTGLERLLAKFRKPRLEAPHDSPQFVERVMDGVAGIRLHRIAQGEFESALGAFRSAIAAVSEPPPSTDFRHSTMSQIRMAHARALEEEEEECSVAEELLLIADRIGVSLCSSTIFCSVAVIGKIGLIPQVPMEQVLILFA